MAHPPIDPDDFPTADADRPLRKDVQEMAIQPASANRMSGCAKQGGCLLTVVLLSAVFAWGIHWVSDYLIPLSNEFRTKVVMKKLQGAIGYFQVEYSRFPLPPTVSDKKDVTLRSRGAWIAALLAQDEGINPRKIKFFAAPTAKNGKEGLLQQGNEWVLVDRWGEAYHVLFDTDRDNRITNPGDAAKFISDIFAFYSSGPDRDPTTWEDNICSWK